jgi:hypothetical protein
MTSVAEGPQAGIVVQGPRTNREPNGLYGVALYNSSFCKES